MQETLEQRRARLRLRAEQRAAQFGDRLTSDPPRQDVSVTTTENDEAKEQQQPPSRWSDRHVLDPESERVAAMAGDDQCRLRHQNFVVFSFIGKNEYKTLRCGDRTYEGNLIKVRGVFKTRENADLFARETLMAEDPTSRVWLGRCFAWTPLDACARDDDMDNADRKALVHRAIQGYSENETIRVSGMQARIDAARTQDPRGEEESLDFLEKSLEAREADDSAAEPAETEIARQTLVSDPVRFPDQQWAVLSCIQPTEFRSPNYPNTDLTLPLIKFRGVFSSREAAETHIMERLVPIDGSIDVSLIPCFHWAGLDDDRVEDRHYAAASDRYNLNEVMQGYLANENDRIFDTPQERLMRAREKRSEMERNGVPDTALPYDARLIGDNSSVSVGAAEITSAGR